jgi:hypothetical protein
MDRLNLPEMPSHGGNTGSNPVGDANKRNYLENTSLTLPTNLPQRRRWTVPDGGGLKVAFAVDGTMRTATSVTAS